MLSSNVRSGAGRRERRAGDARWPSEVEPRQQSVMRDDAAPACCAAAFGQPLLFFSDDVSDALMQLYARPGERWFVCSLLLNDGGDIQCAEERVLGYGAAPSSNIFQRLASVFGSAAADRFEADEAALLALRA